MTADKFPPGTATGGQDSSGDSGRAALAAVRDRGAANGGQDSPGDKPTDDDVRQWPWPVQFVTLLIVLVVATILIILPVLVVRVLGDEYAFSSGTDLWTAMIAILLGLTTMTVSGVFVFMTFRIDRGARLEAQKIAKKETNKAMEDYGKKVADRLHKELEDQFSDSKRKVNDL